MFRFFESRVRPTLGAVLPSYPPGVHLSDHSEPGRESLPDFAIGAIREAIPASERQIRGFAMADAALTDWKATLLGAEAVA